MVEYILKKPYACQLGTLQEGGSIRVMTYNGKAVAFYDGGMVDDGYGNTDIIGYLRNNSTSTWDYVEVMVTWYDKYGNVIDTTYDNVLNLKPNQRWKFTINTYGDCSKFKITKVTIDNW